MKTLIKASMLTALLVLTSCAHHGHKCDSECASQCEMHKDGKKECNGQCHMKKDEKAADQKAETTEQTKK